MSPARTFLAGFLRLLPHPRLHPPVRRERTVVRHQFLRLQIHHQQHAGPGGQRHMEGGVPGKILGQVGDGQGVFTISTALLARKTWLLAGN